MRGLCGGCDYYCGLLRAREADVARLREELASVKSGKEKAEVALDRSHQDWDMAYSRMRDMTEDRNRMKEELDHQDIRNTQLEEWLIEAFNNNDTERTAKQKAEAELAKCAVYERRLRAEVQWHSEVAQDLWESWCDATAERDYFRGAFKGMSEHASWLRKELEWYADEDNYVRWARSTRQDALVGSASERESCVRKLHHSVLDPCNCEACRRSEKET